MLPIFLLHGFPMDSSMWKAQVQFLKNHRDGAHAIFAPDMLGFGPEPRKQAPPLAKATIDAYAEDIHGVITEQAGAGGRAIVGGFSMGGYVLLALLRDYPQDIAAAMFFDTRPDADSTDARTARLKSIDDIRANGPATLIETMMPRLLGKHPPPLIVQHTRSLLQRQSPDALIAAQTAMAKRRDNSDLLPTIKIPTLIIVGAEDVITPPSVAISMQTHMPHAMLVQIVSAGHLTPIEQPDAFNAAIKGFLATIKHDP